MTTVNQNFSYYLNEYLDERDLQNGDYYDNRYIGDRLHGREYMQKLADKMDEMIGTIKDE